MLTKGLGAGAEIGRRGISDPIKREMFKPPVTSPKFMQKAVPIIILVGFGGRNAIKLIRFTCRYKFMKLGENIVTIRE